MSDRISGALTASIIVAWGANVVDLGIFDPARTNLWRFLAGKDTLPYDYFREVAWSITRFPRWWFVVLVASCAAGLAVFESLGGLPFSLKRFLLLSIVPGSFLVWEYAIWYPPLSKAGLWQWIVKVLFFSVAWAVFAIGPYLTSKKAISFVEKFL